MRTKDEELKFQEQEDLKDFLGFLQERVENYDELWDEFFETIKEEPKLYCKNCGGILEQMPTKYGDPEGIRHDQKCTDCGQMHGVTKAAIYKMGFGPNRRIYDLDKTVIL